MDTASAGRIGLSSKERYMAMMLSRRHILSFATGAVAASAVSRTGWAQAYPNRPIHIVVGFPAGTAPDVIARLLAQRLSQHLNQQFVIENRPGAGSNIAAESVARSPPDGYTLLLVTSANTINSTLYANREFNFNRDIAPIGMIVDLPFVMLLNPQVPAKSVPEFIAYARANPGKINVASRGNGTASHILCELFMMRTSIGLVHVPYRGDYMADLLGGQVQVAFPAIADCVEQIADGKLRALGVTSSSRDPQLPDVPAIAEFLPGYEATGLVGIGAPAATSEEIIETLDREINVIMGDPGLKSRLLALGMEAATMSPAAFGKYITVDTEKWASVIRFAHIRPD
jgi:tripartite-type tricarboxylate transporter receptor subunit TctC